MTPWWEWKTNHGTYKRRPPCRVKPQKCDSLTGRRTIRPIRIREFHSWPESGSTPKRLDQDCISSCYLSYCSHSAQVMDADCQETQSYTLSSRGVYSHRRQRPGLSEKSPVVKWNLSYNPASREYCISEGENHWLAKEWTNVFFKLFKEFQQPATLNFSKQLAWQKDPPNREWGMKMMLLVSSSEAFED